MVAAVELWEGNGKKLWQLKQKFGARDVGGEDMCAPHSKQDSLSAGVCRNHQVTFCVQVTIGRVLQWR